tara:strand:+ start:627 stop:1328 length:702 start_codon:yes stop_codon:yes gene_type:complete
MSSFVKISDLILSKISENLKIDDIWEISKINAEEWEILSEKISSLKDRDLNDLNNQLITIVNNIDVGDFWKILIFSRKFTDIQLYLPALDFDEELNKRSLSVYDFISNFSYWAKDHPKIINYYCNDALISMIDNAIFEGNKEQLIEIFSVVIWQGVIPADLESEEIQTVTNENTNEYSQIYEKYFNNTNLKDDMVENLVFIICNLYNTNDKNLRNEDGGISLTKIISHLQSYM